MKMKLRLIVLMAVFSIYAQDEFFQKKKSIGGYGELHYNSSAQGDVDATKKLDFHRFIIYYAASFTESWSFFSEVELEHNFVQDGDGELELEQAYVNYHTDKWGFQGGVILPTVGLLNEYHEPPLFFSVERPDYNKYIIPTTWFGNGFALYGSMPGLNMRFVLMEDMEGERIGAGIRSGRGKGYKTTAYDWVKNISLNYTEVSGLRIGGSYTMNNAPINNNPDSTVSFGLGEFNIKYDANNLYAVLEYGTISYENNPDGENKYVVNLGSGVESFFKRVFKPLKSLIRIGIPHDGKVNAYGDAMALPLKNDSVDLFFSSSVIEHLPDPEKAVSELFRTIKPGGLVYAEIPFIGAYHMAPYDYQRYTISGIESLFNRHGFKLVEKGICTGPITALVLLFQHAIVEAIPIGPIQYLFRVTLTWILHPLKYLDFLFGRTKWAEYLACNFFYLGRKPG